MLFPFAEISENKQQSCDTFFPLLVSAAQQSFG